MQNTTIATVKYIFKVQTTVKYKYIIRCLELYH